MQLSEIENSVRANVSELIGAFREKCCSRIEDEEQFGPQEFEEGIHVTHSFNF